MYLNMEKDIAQELTQNCSFHMYNNGKYVTVNSLDTVFQIGSLSKSFAVHC